MLLPSCANITTIARNIFEIQKSEINMEIGKAVINGQTIYFEFDIDSDYNIEDVSIKNNLSKAADAFESALDTIEIVAKETIKKIKKFDQDIAPDEFEFQFGIKLNGEYGAVLAKVGGEAQLSIKMTYRHKKAKK